MSMEQSKPQREETREPPSPRPLPIRAAQHVSGCKEPCSYELMKPREVTWKDFTGGVVRQRSLLQGRRSGWGAPQGTPDQGHSFPRPPAPQQSLPDTQM